MSGRVAVRELGAVQIICWNMAAGYGYDSARHAEAWAWLNSQGSDVALLQETVVSPAIADGWTSVVHSPTYTTSRIPWGTAVCVRGATYSRHPAADEGWMGLLGGAVCVAAPRDRAGLWLVSVHSNAYPLTPERLRGRSLDEVALCSDGEVWQIELAHDLARLLAGRRFVIGGDLNSSRRFDEVNGYRKNERLFANLAAGFMDLRSRHSEAEQRTFFRAGTGPYQLDHIFADTATEAQMTSWTVLTDVAETMRLSDHARSSSRSTTPAGSSSVADLGLRNSADSSPSFQFGREDIATGPLVAGEAGPRCAGWRRGPQPALGDAARRSSGTRIMGRAFGTP